MLVAAAWSLATAVGSAQSGGLLFNMPLLDSDQYTRSIVADDFDGDGRTDLATAGAGVKVFLGNGNGSFTTALPPMDVGDPWSITSADFDGDGHKDLATANNLSSDVRLFLGVGDGTFANGGSISVGSRPRALVAADLDTDGHQDLAVANYGDNSVTVLLGDGDGTFTGHGTWSAGNGPQSMGVGDFDADGIPDLAVAAITSDHVSVLLGDGAGGFATSVAWTVGQDPWSVAVADVNADGQLDVATANATSGDVMVLLGNGEGGFAPSGPYPIGPTCVAIAVADINGDGLPDVAAKCADFIGILFGEPEGGLAPAALTPTGDYVGPMAVADFDGQGMLDVVVAETIASGPQSKGRVLLGVGHGSFGISTPILPGLLPDISGLAVDDFDEDGAADLVTPASETALAVLLGGGDGSFTLATVPVPLEPGRCTTGDFNGDGHSDIATQSSSKLGVLHGNGDGTFAEAGPPVELGPGSLGFDAAFVAGDVNADGLTDIVSGRKLLLAPSLLVAATFLVDDEIDGAVIADLDGDGTQDVALAGMTFLDRNMVWILLGQGDGTFVLHTQFPANSENEFSFLEGFVSGDFDEDGVVDLAAHVSKNPGLAIFLGHGDGTFVEVALLDSGFGPDMTAADLDADGHVDLATSDGTLHLGDGRGGFKQLGPFHSGATVVPFVRAADFDGDAFPDLVTGSHLTPHLFLMLNQSLSPGFAWTDLGHPLAGLAGTPRLVGTGTLAAGSAGQLAISDAAPLAASLLFVSLIGTPTPFKGGTLVPVPFILAVPLVTDSAGHAVIPWAAWPAGLSGSSLYFQGAIQDGGAIAGVALTNAVTGKAAE